MIRNEEPSTMIGGFSSNAVLLGVVIIPELLFFHGEAILLQQWYDTLIAHHMQHFAFSNAVTFLYVSAEI
ncbi:hypothetical protein [Brevibacillus reuszeri]|uniref:hypothetical protein n=1 Tax=Brevibacillus reuszeri TaxID=54915 RepID=UPI00289F81DE|nr:hypothetical protein [Brevibacillus reuszeri]